MEMLISTGFQYLKSGKRKQNFDLLRLVYEHRLLLLKFRLDSKSCSFHFVEMSRQTTWARIVCEPLSLNPEADSSPQNDLATITSA